MSQTSLFDKPALKLRKPIRLIELFAGIGAQAKALERIGANFQRWFVCDFDRFAIASYNAVHGTDFAPSDITQIHATDLRIEDTDHFDYILTYSFPCTDLSKAGEQKGMARASGTRSGLLWEVERILKECETLPQVLLMENVPDVVGVKNINDFREWIHFLESLGYTSEGEILNAVDFDVPQHRERCFMVSWLGEYSYTFPSPIQKTRKLVDMLEDEVDEKFYVPDEKVQKLIDSQILKVERERESSRTVRIGGNGSLDRHQWDMVIECGERRFIPDDHGTLCEERGIQPNEERFVRRDRSYGILDEFNRTMREESVGTICGQSYGVTGHNSKIVEVDEWRSE